MESSRFQTAIAGIQHLVDAGVTDLVAAGIVTQTRPDGLPQDWVDDVPSLTAAQALELKDLLAGNQGQWATALRGML